jgi:hypothetical protein
MGLDENQERRNLTPQPLFILRLAQERGVRKFIIPIFYNTSGERILKNPEQSSLSKGEG